MNPLCKVFIGFCLFVMFPFKGFAQQEFKLNGVLIENGSKIRIALAVISNKRNGYSVGSNDLGIFEIKTAIGDTLLINKRGFNDLTAVVSSNKSMVLKLNRGISLDEVLIKGKSKAQALADIEQDFKAKGSFYAGKPPIALLSPFGGSPLTFLYELFGKTPANARRFNRYKNIENEQSHIDQFFNKAIVAKYTGLTASALDDFMIKYRPDYEQTKTWSAYDGVKWIVDSFKKYEETVKPPI
jgi:hypothetical protein